MISRTRLPEALCDEIDAFARKTPALVEDRTELTLFDQDRPVSKTYRILEPDVVRSRAMQDPLTKMMLGVGLVAVMLVAGWRVFNGQPGNSNAFIGFATALVITFMVYWRMNSPHDAYWMMPLMGAAQLAVFAHGEGRLQSPAELSASYIRCSDAELHWKG